MVDFCRVEARALVRLRAHSMHRYALALRLVIAPTQNFVEAQHSTVVDVNEIR